MLSFPQYKFEAKLQLGVRGGNRVNLVERIITLGAPHTGRPPQHKVFMPARKSIGTATSRHGRYPETLHEKFYAKVRRLSVANLQV